MAGEAPQSAPCRAVHSQTKLSAHRQVCPIPFHICAPAGATQTLTINGVGTGTVGQPLAAWQDSPPANAIIKRVRVWFLCALSGIQVSQGGRGPPDASVVRLQHVASAARKTAGRHPQPKQQRHSAFGGGVSEGGGWEGQAARSSSSHTRIGHSAERPAFQGVWVAGGSQGGYLVV